MKNTTNKFLLVSTILLLLANIALVAFIFFGRGKKPAGGGKDMFDKLVKEIGMDGAQKKKYDSMREAHFTKIRPLFDSMRVTRQELFKLIKTDSVNDSLVNVYTNRISEKQTLADKLTLEHFRKVRSFLNADQQIKYEAFVQKMMQRGRRDSSGKGK